MEGKATSWDRRGGGGRRNSAGVANSNWPFVGLNSAGGGEFGWALTRKRQREGVVITRALRQTGPRVDFGGALGEGRNW